MNLSNYHYIVYHHLTNYIKSEQQQQQRKNIETPVTLKLKFSTNQIYRRLKVLELTKCFCAKTSAEPQNRNEEVPESYFCTIPVPYVYCIQARPTCSLHAYMHGADMCVCIKRGNTDEIETAGKIKHMTNFRSVG